MVPVTSGRIERYDTSKSPNAWNAVINRAGQANRSHMPAHWFTSSGTDSDVITDAVDNIELWPTFEIINLKGGFLDDVAQLVVFPLDETSFVLSHELCKDKTAADVLKFKEKSEESIN